jgi:isopenicillin-N N-acyltransferase-like protein
MRSLLRLLYLCLLVIAAESVPADDTRPRRVFREGTSGAGRLEIVEGIPVLTLAGSPAEIGKQHAELTGPALADVAKMPRETVRQLGHEQNWPFLALTARVLMHNAHARHREELDALIAEGHVDRDSLYVGNGLIELRRMGGCATFVAMPDRSETGELIFGRNFDFPSLGVLDTHHLVMVVRPEGQRAFVSVGWPGMVGVASGMNSAGLCVATLDVYETADGSPPFDSAGVPLALTYRRILEECETVAEAQALLESTPRTTYMNLAVADTREAVVFELTPASVGVRSSSTGVVCCTNHFQLDGLAVPDGCQRIEKLREIEGDGRKFDVAAVHAALHAVNQGEFTIQTMVFEPASSRLHLAVGGAAPVSRHPLKTLELSAWLRPEAAE